MKEEGAGAVGEKGEGLGGGGVGERGERAEVEAPVGPARSEAVGAWNIRRRDRGREEGREEGKEDGGSQGGGGGGDEGRTASKWRERCGGS